MEKKILIITILAFSGLFLEAQVNLSDRQFYYYKGERFYLDIDYSRITVVTDGKIDINFIKKSVNSTEFSVKNEERSYTIRNVVPIDEMQNKVLYITEIEFSEILKHTDYYAIIQELSKENDVVKISPAFTVSGKKLGISNNFSIDCIKL